MTYNSLASTWTSAVLTLGLVATDQDGRGRQIPDRRQRPERRQGRRRREVHRRLRGGRPLFLKGRTPRTHLPGLRPADSFLPGDDATGPPHSCSCPSTASRRPTAALCLPAHSMAIIMCSCSDRGGVSLRVPQTTWRDLEQAGYYGLKDRFNELLHMLPRLEGSRQLNREAKRSFYYARGAVAVLNEAKVRPSSRAPRPPPPPQPLPTQTPSPAGRC